MAAVYVVVAVVLLAMVVTSRGRGKEARDPRRTFTVNERIRGFSRAGNRCEHFNVFGMRCSSTSTHADHHYPYSRGGATIMSNFVALCSTHNLRKGSHIPSRLYTNRLERRRRSYFPPGESTEIVWQFRKK